MKILAVTFLAMLVWGCISSEQFKQELAEERRVDRATCERSGHEPRTWGLRYCLVRMNCLRYLSAGFGSQAGSMAAVSIENNRLRCINRVEAWQFDPATYKGETEGTVQQKLDKWRVQARPRLIEKLGEAAGTKALERQAGFILGAFEEAVRFGMREECNQAAMDDYVTWTPVMFKTKVSKRSSASDIQNQQRLRQIEARQSQLENRQRWIEQQQRNLQR